MENIVNSLNDVDVEEIYIGLKDSFYDIVTKNKKLLIDMNDAELQKWASGVEKVDIVSQLLIRYIKENPNVLK